MSKPKKQSAPEQEEGCPMWMLTYGDLVTQLLCFFCLLLSFSTVNDEDFKAAIASFRRALSILRYAPITEVVPLQYEPPIEGTEIRNIRSASEILGIANQYSAFVSQAQQVGSAMDQMKMGGSMHVVANDKEVRLTLSSTVLFEPGKADLSLESYRALMEITRLIKNVPYDINIEGHTDSAPLTDSEYKSNMELSMARALTVLNFIKGQGVQENRLYAIGMGGNRPCASNNTDEGRALNQRVEIAILHSIPDENRTMQSLNDTSTQE